MKKINFTLNFVLNILRTWCFTSCLELNGNHSSSRSTYWSYIVVLKINWTSHIYKLPYPDRLDYVNDGTRTCLCFYWKNFRYYTFTCKYIRVIFLNWQELNHLLAVLLMLDVGALTPFFGDLNVKNYGILWRVSGARMHAAYIATWWCLKIFLCLLMISYFYY